MVTAKAAPTKMKEFFKVNADPKKPAYPAFVKKVHQWAAQVTDEHYKVYSVYQCPDEKLAEALVAITKRYHFYAQIDGYRFRIEVLMEGEDAMKALAG